MSTRPKPQHIDHRATMEATRERLIELRGVSGKLYAKLNPRTLELEFRDGKRVERIRLRDHLP